MSTTKIEWADKVWNPVTGCSKISPGCDNCYAERMSKRQKGRNGYPADDPFRVTVHDDNKFLLPYKWKAPRRIFVNSMGDFFHHSVSAHDMVRIWLIARDNPQHTFIILTKRPKRMKQFYDLPGIFVRFPEMIKLKNIWIGVSVENQEAADERIPVLLDIPAAVRFVSVEPMLGKIDLTGMIQELDWVICGGESGPGARCLHPEWVRSLRDQSIGANVPFFFKSWGDWAPVNQYKNLETYNGTMGGTNIYGSQSREVLIDPSGEILGESVYVKSPDKISPFREGYRDCVYCPDPAAHSDSWWMAKVGKKEASNMLDAKTWEQFPLRENDLR